MNSKVLFFMNNLNRTGSETLLFNFILDVDKTKKIDIGIVLIEKGGELVSEIPSHIPIYYLNTSFSISDKLSFHLGVDIIGNRLKKIQKDYGANSWYFNTIANLNLLKYKPNFMVDTFVHVHELLYNFESLHTNEFKLLLENCDHLIACSPLVQQIFTPYFTKKISVINSTIDQQRLQNLLAKTSPLTSTKIRIISSGTICYRKGTDLFYEVAALLPKDKFECIWLGNFADNAFAEVIKSKNTHTNQIQFFHTETEKEYLQLVKSASIFVSTSREESMGLVMLEAAAFGVPIIALNSGGAELIVNGSNGQICYDARPEKIAQMILDMSSHLSDFQNNGTIPFTYQEEFQKFVSLFTH